MSPRSSQQFQEMRQQSKKLILDAALELFATQGFHNTSITQITKKAGVSKGLVYNYFEKKEDLMTGLMEYLVEDGQQAWEEIAKESDPRKKLAGVFEATFFYLREKRQFVRLITGLALQIQDFPELEEFVKGKYTQEIPVYAHLLETIGIPDPHAESIALAATLDGVGMQYLVLGGAFDLDAMYQHLLKRYDLLDTITDNTHLIDKNQSL